MQFCNITWEAGEALAELLANTRTELEVLNISGNRLAGKGLAKLCKGLMFNTKLQTLQLADNMIDQVISFRTLRICKYPVNPFEFVRNILSICYQHCFPCRNECIIVA